MSRLISILFVIISLLMLSSSRDFSTNAKTFPQILLITLIGLSIILFFTSPAIDIKLISKNVSDNKVKYMKFFITIITTAVFVLLIPFIGYYVSAFGYLFITIGVLGVNIKRAFL